MWMMWTDTSRQSNVKTRNVELLHGCPLFSTCVTKFSAGLTNMPMSGCLLGISFAVLVICTQEEFNLNTPETNCMSL